jgi:hypothetical protein
MISMMLPGRGLPRAPSGSAGSALRVLPLGGFRHSHPVFFFLRLEYDAYPRVQDPATRLSVLNEWPS